jgi:hypothetical protein
LPDAGKRVILLQVGQFERAGFARRQGVNELIDLRSRQSIFFSLRDDAVLPLFLGCFVGLFVLLL